MRIGAKIWIGGGILLALAVVVAPRSTPSSATHPPTEAELRDFARLTLTAFRPTIEAQERKSPPLTPRPVPLALGIADGVAVRVLLPPGVSGGHYNCFLGQLRADGTYISPRVPFGSAIETARYSTLGKTRELRLVLAGKRGTARFSDGFAYDALLAEGDSVMRDLGPLSIHGSRYTLSAPGSTSDGFAIAQRGIPPRRLALAPEELPPATKAERGGYALLFDRVVLWGKREPDGTRSGEILVGPNIPFLRGLLTRRESFSGTEHGYRVSGLAHVYVRRNGRWLYARTWSLDGHGTSWQTENAPTFLRGMVSSTRIAVGAPNLLLASRTELLTP